MKRRYRVSYLKLSTCPHSLVYFQTRRDNRNRVTYEAIAYPCVVNHVREANPTVHPSFGHRDAIGRTW